MKSEETAFKSNIMPLIRSAWRLKWLFFFLGLMIAYGTWHLTKKQTKIYRAGVQIIINLEAPRYLPYNGREVVSLGSGKTWNTKEFFETQFRIIRSRQVSAEVVERLNLKSDLDFLGVAQLSPELREEKLKSRDPISLLKSRISISPIPESHVVSLRVKDHKPERAALLANTIAEVYRKQNVGHKVSAAREAVVWLRRKLTEIGDQRKKAEEGLLTFKTDNDLLQATLGERQNLLGLTIRSLEEQLIKSHQKVVALKSEVRQVKNASGAEAQVSISQVINNTLIQRLKERRLALENEKTALLSQYLNEHPKVKVVSDQLTRINEVITREVKGIQRSLKRELRASERAESSLKETQKDLKKEARALQSQELKYKTLETEAKSSGELYTQMEVRLKEAELQAQTTANNVRILDEARPPKSYVSPRLSLNMAAAAIGWALLCFLILIAIDYLDRTIKSQLQLYDLYQLTALGSVPKIQKGKRPFKQDVAVRNSELYVLENPTSTVSECMRTIRTNLLFMDSQRQLKSLLVTSAAPREGKTLTCINLGITMALSGERVLIIDSDLRRPRVHKVFNLLNDRGFSNMLIDAEVEPDEVTRQTELETLDLLCSGPLPPNPAELLQTPAFKRTLNRLLEEYDRVIFDSPPVVPVTDAQIIGQQIDGTVLVVRAQQTNREILRRAVELLTAVKVNLVGALLNDVDISQEVYGHYYYQYKQDPAEVDPIERRFGQ
jgi:polysaccharide biosynthesis transport protein